MTSELLKARLVDERTHLVEQIAAAEASIHALRGALKFCEHALKVLDTPEPEPESKE